MIPLYPPYPTITIYRPPPAPPPDWLPLQVRSGLAALFIFVSTVLIAALTLAPEPESDRIRKLWKEWGYAPPPVGREVTVLTGKLRFLLDDPNTNRLVIDTGRSPPELWDTDRGRIAILSEQVDGLGQALFSPDRKHLLTSGAIRSHHFDDNAPAQVRVWDLQTGRLIKSISITLNRTRLVGDCRIRWLDNRNALCIVGYWPETRLDGGENLWWVRNIDVLTGVITPYDSRKHGDALSSPWNDRSNDNFVAKQGAGVISAQFGNCYVWSANDETRIVINRDP